MTPIIEVDNLEVTFNPPTGEVHAVRGVSFEIQAGEILGIVGESGSGKSVSMRALLGLTPTSAIVTGSVSIEGATGSPAESADRVRKMAALVYQNPGAALNPVFTIGFQLGLAAGTTDRAALTTLLEQVGLPEPERALDAYPHEYSGGMQQRAVIALALAQQPRLLVADEPTTALDVTTEAQILDLLLRLREEHDLSIAFISHDLAVIRRISDKVIVLKDGEVIESGATTDVLSHPQEPYTQMLVASMPGAASPRSIDEEASAPLLELSGVTVEFRRGGRERGANRVLDGLDLSVRRGETLALVGESGSGKSTLANAVAGLVPQATGSITFDGIALVDPTGRNGRRKRSRTRREVQHRLQMVFQNPLLALSPRKSIRWQLHEPQRIHTARDRTERQCCIDEMIDRLELDGALLDRRPHELSGGQAQRVVLARALLLDPEFIVFDEPTSALDVSVQAAVLDLLAELKSDLGLTYLFITHDLAVACHLADRIAVMRKGVIVELRPTEQLFTNPHDPYTAALLASNAALTAAPVNSTPSGAQK